MLRIILEKSSLCTQEREGGGEETVKQVSRRTRESLHGRSHCFATFLLGLELQKIKMVPKSSLKKGWQYIPCNKV